MPDYSKCIIYQIKCLETGDVYIGSTTRSLQTRMSQHKDLKYSTTTSKQIIERGNYKEEVLLYCSCRDMKELHRLEGNFILAEPNCINKCIAGRTEKEWLQDNKDKVKQRDKQYRQDNKDNIKQYRQDNKDNIKQYKKQYYQDNIDKIRQRKKQYYQDNKTRRRQIDKQYYQNNKDRKKNRAKWINSWGGDPRSNNNLISIKV
jgi:hypothetical protein